MAHKMTLLEIVQDILDSLDYDTVNSIDDTLEAQQIASTVKSIYYDLISRRDWEHLKVVGKLEQVGDVDQPTKIKMPDNLYRIELLQYNKKLSSDSRDKYADLIYRSPQEFLKLSMGRDSSDSSVETAILDDGVPLYVRNDVMPTYWTTFDQEYIYFDSYYSDDETTVQANKTLVYGVREPTWTVSDSFIPDLPSQLFPLLLETVRKTCAKRYKQIVDQEAEIASRKQYNLAKQQQYRANGGMKFFNWGRKK